MKRLWFGFLLMLSLWVAPVGAVELNGTWLGNDGETYTIRQDGKTVTIASKRDRMRGELTEDQYFVLADKVKWQWIDDDTLVLKEGNLGKLTKLKRKL
jgi:hypothetical protein